MKRRTTKNKKKYSIKGGSGKGKQGTKRKLINQSKPQPQVQEDINETGLIPMPERKQEIKKINIFPFTLPGPISGVSNSKIYDKITGEPVNTSNINVHTSIIPQFPVTPPRNINEINEIIIETPGSQKSEGNMSFSDIFNSQGTPSGSRINSVNSSPIPSPIPSPISDIDKKKVSISKNIPVPYSDVNYSINTEGDLAGNPYSNRFGKGGKKKIKKKIKKTRKRNKK